MILYHIPPLSPLPSLKQAISQLKDIPGPLDLDGALDLLHNEIYTPEGGDRPNVRNVVMFIIDDVSNKNQQRVIRKAEACHLAGRYTNMHINSSMAISVSYSFNPLNF